MCAARATRLVGPPSTLAGVLIAGLVVTLPWALLQGRPALDASTTRALIASGVGNCAGLLLVYTSLRVGKVGIVAPIVSTEGAVAALIAVVAGESLAPGTGIALAVVAVGTALAGASSGQTHSRAHDRTAVLFAGAAALSFGASLYATGLAGAQLPVAWVILPPRLVGVIAIALPLTLAGR